MNAPVTPPDRRSDYEPTVKTFMPTSHGIDLEIRCSFLLIRDSALVAKRYCSDDAWPIMDHIERLAGRYAFESHDPKRFAEMRDGLRLLVRAASIIDNKDSDGSADARG